MAVEHDLDVGEAPSDMKEDMVDADLGQPEACKLAIVNVYWMVESIQAVDSAWMDLGETPVGPQDEEGVERFIGVIKERHERTGGSQDVGLTSKQRTKKPIHLTSGSCSERGRATLFPNW